MTALSPSGDEPAAAPQARAGPAPGPSMRAVDLWLLIRFLHIVAVSAFLGGQIFLAAAVVPVERDRPDRIRALARRFGAISAVSFLVLLITGALMASHYDLWGSGEFHVKLALVVALLISVGVHIHLSANRMTMAVTFILTLATVWQGLNLVW